MNLFLWASINLFLLVMTFAFLQLEIHDIVSIERLRGLTFYK